MARLKIFTTANTFSSEKEKRNFRQFISDENKSYDHMIVDLPYDIQSDGIQIGQVQEITSCDEINILCSDAWETANDLNIILLIAREMDKPLFFYRVTKTENNDTQFRKLKHLFHLNKSQGS